MMKAGGDEGGKEGTTRLASSGTARRQGWQAQEQQGKWAPFGAGLPPCVAAGFGSCCCTSWGMLGLGMLGHAGAGPSRGCAHKRSRACLPAASPHPMRQAVRECVAQRTHACAHAQGARTCRVLPRCCPPRGNTWQQRGTACVMPNTTHHMEAAPPSSAEST